MKKNNNPKNVEADRNRRRGRRTQCGKNERQMKTSIGGKTRSGLNQRQNRDAHKEIKRLPVTAATTRLQQGAGTEDRCMSLSELKLTA
jgi:hypothetical protein